MTGDACFLHCAESMGHQRVLGYIESGKADGATVVTGGARKGDKGYFVEPTIFTNVKPDMKIIREEIFGPVCAVIKFKEEEEVIELANDTIYGLSSVVFTENISRAIRVAHALEAGQTFVRGSSNDANDDTHILCHRSTPALRAPRKFHLAASSSQDLERSSVNTHSRRTYPARKLCSLYSY